MSSNLLDTEKGGEQTQYEGEASDMAPHAREAGQLGASAIQGGSTQQPTAPASRAKNEPNTHGITAADKIRYGQSIQEGGMGGKTGTVTGEVDGATGEPSAEKQREMQGYGGGKDMDATIGG